MYSNIASNISNLVKNIVCAISTKANDCSDAVRNFFFCFFSHLVNVTCALPPHYSLTIVINIMTNVIKDQTAHAKILVIIHS